MPAKLRAAFLEAVESGRVRSMQNKSMAAAPLHRAGALLLGDAFNMRHPLTGAATVREFRVQGYTLNLPCTHNHFETSFTANDKPFMPKAAPLAVVSHARQQYQDFGGSAWARAHCCRMTHLACIIRSRVQLP